MFSQFQQLGNINYYNYRSSQITMQSENSVDLSQINTQNISQGLQSLQTFLQRRLVDIRSLCQLQEINDQPKSNIQENIPANLHMLFIQINHLLDFSTNIADLPSCCHQLFIRQCIMFVNKLQTAENQLDQQAHQQMNYHQAQYQSKKVKYATEILKKAQYPKQILVTIQNLQLQILQILKQWINNIKKKARNIFQKISFLSDGNFEALLKAVQIDYQTFILDKSIDHKFFEGSIGQLWNNFEQQVKYCNSLLSNQTTAFDLGQKLGYSNFINLYEIIIKRINAEAKSNLTQLYQLIKLITKQINYGIKNSSALSVYQTYLRQRSQKIYIFCLAQSLIASWLKNYKLSRSSIITKIKQQAETKFMAKFLRDKKSQVNTTPRINKIRHLFGDNQKRIEPLPFSPITQKTEHQSPQKEKGPTL